VLLLASSTCEGKDCACVVEAYLRKQKFTGGSFNPKSLHVEVIKSLGDEKDPIGAVSLQSLAEHIKRALAGVTPNGATEPTHDMLLNFSRRIQRAYSLTAAFLAAIYPFIQLRYLYATAEKITEIPGASRGL